MSITNALELDDVFEELNNNKILSKQAFSCCDACGSSQLSRELDKYPEFIGFCFYHRQDLNSAAEDGHLYVGYHSTFAEASAEKKIAETIIEIFKKHRFKTEWDNSIATRIKIKLPTRIINKLKKKDDVNKNIEENLSENETLSKEENLSDEEIKEIDLNDEDIIINL